MFLRGHSNKISDLPLATADAFNINVIRNIPILSKSTQAFSCRLADFHWGYSKYRNVWFRYLS